MILIVNLEKERFDFLSSSIICDTDFTRTCLSSLVYAKDVKCEL